MLIYKKDLKIKKHVILPFDFSWFVMYKGLSKSQKKKKNTGGLLMKIEREFIFMLSHDKGESLGTMGMWKYFRLLSSCLHITKNKLHDDTRKLKKNFCSIVFFS